MAGGGKGGQKMEVTLYHMSQHFGICSPVDGIRKIWVKEKLAWSGYATALTAIAVDKQELFGGDKKEGGVAGLAYFLPGRDDQLLPDALAARLQRPSGAACPGFRGLASVFFVGNGGGMGGGGGITIGGTGSGFYWAANNPYLPAVWIEVRRAPVGLDPAYAMVPRAGTDFFPAESTASPTTFTGAQVSRDGTMLYAIAATSFMSYSLTTRTLVTHTSIDPGLVVGGVYAITPDGIYGVNDDEVVVVALDGSSSATIGTGGHWAGAWYAGGEIILTPLAFEGMHFGKPGSPNAEIVTDYYPTCVFEDLTGAAMAVGTSSLVSPGHDFSIGAAPGLAAATIDTTSYGSSGTVDAFVNSVGNYVVLHGTVLFLLDPSFAVLNHVTVSSAPVHPGNVFSAIRPGVMTFWLELTQYNALDLSVIRSVTPGSWPGGISPSEIADYYYDPTNNAIISFNSIAEPAIHFRFLDRGELDANPAHIIYESLTNTDWGMGSPAELIDTASFETAGLVLYNEPLGLSMIWTRQAEIEKFIQEVLDHIQGVLFVDPQTGLLTLKLIRGDYDVDTLPVLDESNANLTNFGRKLWGEISNEIVVTWTNPETEQDETVSVHDLASVATQGGLVSDSRNYYGVRYADLAKRLAIRDLRSAGAPLASCEAEVDRTQWALRPASCVKLNWPEYGLSGVVMRITKIGYGKPGDATIKLTLVEDVFGLDAGAYTAPPASAWIDPSQQPDAADDSKVVTLPYYAVAQEVSPSTATYPEVLAGVLAASANADIYSVELWGVLDGTWQSLAGIGVLARGELSADLGAAASSTGVGVTGFIGAERPLIGDIALIGDGSDTETELARVTSGSSGTYALSRGVLDTVPRAWPAGTPIWFLNTSVNVADPNTRSAGEVVTYKLRTRTSQGLLQLGATPTVNGTLSDRPWLPNRPANVEIGGVGFNDIDTPVDQTGESVVTVTWANRNRRLEDSTILGWTDATVTPEAEQTTTITVLDVDGTTVLTTHEGLTGTSFDIPLASFVGHEVAIVEVAASRTDDDGTFTSLQAHRLYVQVQPLYTEVGTLGITAGTNIYAMGGGDYKNAVEITVPAGGAWFKHVVVRMTQVGSGAHLRPVIYTGRTATDTIVATGQDIALATLAPTSGGVEYTLSFNADGSAVHLSAGTYGLCCHVTGVVSCNANGGFGAGVKWNADTYSDGPSNPFGTLGGSVAGTAIIYLPYSIGGP